MVQDFGLWRVVEREIYFYTNKEFVVDNPLFRIHLTILTIKWTGLAPWEFEFRLAGNLTSIYLHTSTAWLPDPGTMNAPPSVERTTDALS
jgi:hypothetical protein